MTEAEIVGWYHWLYGHEFEKAPGVGDGQGSLTCCSPWGHKELDTTERLNWTELIRREVWEPQTSTVGRWYEDSGSRSPSTSQAVVPEATRNEERGREHIVPHSPQEEPTMLTIWLPASSTRRQYCLYYLNKIYLCLSHSVCGTSLWHPLEIDTVPKGKEEAGKGCFTITGEESLGGE